MAPPRVVFDRVWKKFTRGERHDPWRAETRDQRAREEARPVHRHDVPLNAEIGIADREAAHLHGERRRGHHEIHHGIGDHATQGSGNEARLPTPADVIDMERRYRVAEPVTV